MQKNFWIGFGLAVFGTLLFSVKSIFIKFAYLADSNAEEVLFLRMLISLPVYGFIAWFLLKKHKEQVKAAGSSLWLKVIGLGFLGYFLSSWLDLWGLEMISAQLERLTLFTYPIMVAILGALFFKQPLTRKIVFALVLSYIGIWVIYFEEAQFYSEDIALGTWLVAAAAFSFALYVLFSRKVILEFGSPLFTSLAMLAACFWVVGIFGIKLDFTQVNFSQEVVFWSFLLAIFSTVIPSFMISEAIARLGPAQTGIIGSLGPVFTIVLAVWLLAEPFTWWHLLGFSLVMLGVLSLSWKSSRKTAEVN